MKNRFAKKVVNEILKSHPVMLSNCPFNGTFVFTNIKMENFVSTLPDGKYNFDIVLKDLKQKCKIHFNFYTIVGK